MLSCIVGVMAYNEEANIGNFLDRMLNQELKNVRINRIFVVASGCTDATVEISREYMKKSKIINVLAQEKREGKASAINYFLTHVDLNPEDIIVLISADTLPEKDLIEKLVGAFDDEEVGMTGAHSVPVNKPDNFIGYTVQLIWELHHQIALVKPKMGEAIAFRNIFRRIPFDSAVDEANIEPLILGQGYKLKYVPDAIVKNKGSTNIRDHIRQRRRIYAGHLAVRKYQGYSTSTMSASFVFGNLLKIMKWEPKHIGWTISAILIEIYCRYLGKQDFLSKKKSHATWEIAKSTKDLSEG